jgi:radical SAM protein with 4Fe4S-binding SPASM domain
MIESLDSEENATFLRNFTGLADEIQLEPVMNWNDPDDGNLSGMNNEELLQTGFFNNKKKACPFPFYTLVIHSDLRVSVCCVDWNKKVVVGDLKSQSLQEIWQGEALYQFQLLHLQGRRKELEGCRNCTFLHTAPDNLDNLSPDVFSKRAGRQCG